MIDPVLALKGDATVIPLCFVLGLGVLLASDLPPDTMHVLPPPDISCDCDALLTAARRVNSLLFLSTETTSNDLLYRSPAQGLREAATAMDQKDDAVRQLRAALEKCKP